MNLKKKGRMVKDNIVDAYMILLVESKRMYTRVVHSGFLTTLKKDGWEQAHRYLKETLHAKGNWMTSKLIFIPGFIGEQTCGHWVNIIIENIHQTNRTIYVLDSLGITADYNHIKNLFVGTSF